MLCSSRSLLRKSTVPPAGTTTTRGMKTHPFWSISTLAAGAGAAPAGGFSIHTTAFFNSLREDSSRSPESFSVPHTYWSMVTSTFFGAGTGPAKTTEPLIEPAALTLEAPRPTSSKVAAIVNCTPLIACSLGRARTRLAGPLAVRRRAQRRIERSPPRGSRSRRAAPRLPAVGEHGAASVVNLLAYVPALRPDETQADPKAGDAGAK